MKKLAVKLVAIILAITLTFSIAAAASASKDDSFAKTAGVSALAGIVTGALKGVNAVIPDNKEFKPISEHVTENFYEGTGSFLNQPAPEAEWSLGYAKVSLVPSDWQTKKYYLGGYITAQNGFSNNVEVVVDDMCARIIAVQDGSGRGVSVFATIDCIGMTNADIREIRNRLSKLDLGGVRLNCVTVSSTHAHSCIDTEGLWTNTFQKAFSNIFKSFFRADLATGTDPEYMDFLFTKVSGAMKEAVADMKPGTMSYAQKDISDAYFNNKNRSSASSLMTDMTRIVFTPSDTTAEPTMIVNVAAHPDVAGLATDQSTGRELCGEYIYYMDETIKAAGYNFMFFNGAIAGIYMGRGATNDGVDMPHRYQQSERYGRELGRIALSLNLTKEEISANPLITDWDTINEEKKTATDYTLWFEDWTPVRSYTLPPILNLVFKEVKVEITNPLMKLAGKLNLAHYDVYKDGLKYFVFTEIGYMELGDMKIALMPGEVCQDLVCGGTSLTADGSYSGKAFGFKSIKELFGEDTICFGIANDAIGYVIPDNDFCMAIVDDHYQELISLGKATASTIMQGYADIQKALA